VSSTGLGGPPPPVDLKAELRQAVQSLHGAGIGGQATTSDLSIDQELLLHAIGWEPVELVAGVSLFSVPMGVWNWGQGEVTTASAAYLGAFDAASGRLHRQCAKAGGHGVVGVQIDLAVEPHHVDVSLLGTAIRPVGAKRLDSAEVFISDLSARDFALLMASGWKALGLAVGASFVNAPRRSLGATLQQSSQNVELTNFTEAMYSARESAMERMQAAALRMGGTGVVEVKVTEGPMDFARHAVGFTALGTVVALAGGSHRVLQPSMVLPMDDPVSGFEVTALRGR
jgi:uncharacterized protein YbjQ (UPF0145 family)